MLTLNATAGSPTANAYVTMAQATLLLDGRLHTEPWYTPAVLTEESAAALQARRVAALVSATRLLDEHVTWYGTPTTREQALAWPMQGQMDRYGRAVDPTTIPLVIQQATAFYALALLRDGSEDVEATQQALVQSERVGDVQIVYRASQTQPRPPARGLPAELRSLLRAYGTMVGGSMIPLVRT